METILSPNAESMSSSSEGAGGRGEGKRVRSLVMHAHFYQPPRENPWLDEVEIEVSAAPFHDWNQRIERECYRAVVAARVHGVGGRIAQVVNTLEWISFNFGPTLLEWMEHAAPDTYRAVLLADAASVRRLGTGNAIAQPYHHAILPLASRRDKTTEVRWGIADFRRRFGREPVGMWLPETAVDDETLDVLAAEGIRFTIVAPSQVRDVPPLGMPGSYTTANGRQIALCVYHGDMSHGIAFGGVLSDALRWVEAIERFSREQERDTGEAVALARKAQVKPRDPRLVDPGVALMSAATDGETYGHHHRFGEMALARMLLEMRERGTVIENYASFLLRHPAVHEVTLVAPSAWSCAHGVERWRSDCGCKMDGARYPSQAWRTPLREGLNALGEGLHRIFESEGAAYLRDPWAARDAYGHFVADPSAAAFNEFLDAQAVHPLTPDERVRARQLLELERDALRMFTSCAWFFDDIGGLEPRQVLRYAARAIALAGPAAAPLETELLATLATAVSNDRAVGTGRDVYLMYARSKAPAAARIAAAELAAHTLGVHHEIEYASANVATSRDRVTVMEKRTGRTHQYRGRVFRVGSSDVEIELHVEGSEAAPHVFTVRDLPEGARLEIRSVLRRQLLPRCLTPVELDHLAAGDVQLRGLAAVALQRNIARLVEARIDEALELVNALLDLFEQLELKIPFDAQTAFWEVSERVDATRRMELAALRWRLGFLGDVGERELAPATE
ncbi:MAG: DUF3536 domain-containing protein [Gemmatimonadaceae bacterium]